MPTKKVHYPKCGCDSKYAIKLRMFSNRSIHLYRVCLECGKPSTSPIPKNSVNNNQFYSMLQSPACWISQENWQEAQNV